MFDPALLFEQLARPEIAAMDDAAAAAALSAPTYTPRTTPVTIASLSASDVWGFEKAAAFEAALTAAAATMPAAQTLLSILRGPGFVATDPQASALAPSFVAMAGGSITDDDAAIALGIPQFSAGGPVAETDVTAARAQLTRDAEISALRTLATAALESAHNLMAIRTGKIDALARGTGGVPDTLEQVDAIQA